MVPEADGARRRRGRYGVVGLPDVVNRGDQLVHLGRQGRVEAGEQFLGGDQAQIPAGGRDRDGRGERSGDVGRHCGGYGG